MGYCSSLVYIEIIRISKGIFYQSDEQDLRINWVDGIRKGEVWGSTGSEREDCFFLEQFFPKMNLAGWWVIKRQFMVQMLSKNKRKKE